MRCSLCRELLSANLDGEATEMEQAAMAAHLSECASCGATEAELVELHRRVRVRAAHTVPDLSARIIQSADVVARRQPRILVLRYGLCVAALGQLFLSLPELISTTVHDELHNSHHLAGWAAAFSLGLLVVGAQPWRSRGLLPMACALVGAMTVMSVIDITHGQVPGLTQASHALELTSLVLLWLLARVAPSGPISQPRRWRRPSDGQDELAPSAPARPVLASAATGASRIHADVA